MQKINIKNLIPMSFSTCWDSFFSVWQVSNAEEIIIEIANTDDRQLGFQRSFLALPKINVSLDQETKESFPNYNPRILNQLQPHF